MRTLSGTFMTAPVSYLSASSPASTISGGGSPPDWRVHTPGASPFGVLPAATVNAPEWVPAAAAQAAASALWVHGDHPFLAVRVPVDLSCNASCHSLHASLQLHVPDVHVMCMSLPLQGTKQSWICCRRAALCASVVPCLHSHLLLGEDAELPADLPCAGPVQHGHLKLKTYNTNGHTPQQRWGAGSHSNRANTRRSINLQRAAPAPRHANNARKERKRECDSTLWPWGL